MYLLLRKKRFKGFSSPEVMLSVFILSIGLVSVVAIISSSLRYSMTNRDIITASELAQEGVELIRNVRDNDFAEGNNGFSEFSNRENCRIDWNDAVTSLDCSNSQAAARYYLQYRNGTYGHYSNTTDRFSRYIYINRQGGGDNERATIRSFVFWGRAFNIPNNGSVSNCNLQHNCVYSEAFLTAWK